MIEYSDMIDYCAHCWEKIDKGEMRYICPSCRLAFCSFLCLEEHTCGWIKFPEIKIPWEDDEELKDLGD